jgi:uncharacterized caspase-like protein
LRQGKPFPANVAIMSLADRRQRIRTHGTLFALIPFIPFGTDKLQNGSGINWDSVPDVSKLDAVYQPPLVLEWQRKNPSYVQWAPRGEKEIPLLLKRYLSETNAFEQVSCFSGRVSLPAEADFIVSGSVTRWALNLRSTTYGLGIGESLLRLLGLPSLQWIWDVDYSLVFTDATAGKGLLRREYRQVVKSPMVTICPWLIARFFRAEYRGFTIPGWEFQDLLPVVRESMEDFVRAVHESLPPPDDTAYWKKVAQDRAIRVARATGKSPTQIEISYPRDGMRTGESSIIVRGQVDSVVGLASIEVLLNGDQLQIVDLSTSPAADRRHVSIVAAAPALRRGENIVEVRAGDVAGMGDRRTLAVLYEPAEPLKPTVAAAFPILLAPRRQIALVIGIDIYAHYPPLQNAVSDAKAVAAALNRDYGFEVISLYNDRATRGEILRRFRSLVEAQSEGDNVLIYYSGHGAFIEVLNQGYWVPADAQSDTDYLWNAQILALIQAMDAKKVQHVFLVADACFSGALISGTPRAMIPAPADPNNLSDYFRRVDKDKSRLVLASGTKRETVPDGGREGHSVFGYYFLRFLENRDNPAFTANDLAHWVQKTVGVNMPWQTPQMATLLNAGDEGGQMVFVRKHQEGQRLNAK